MVSGFFMKVFVFEERVLWVWGGSIRGWVFFLVCW